MQPQNPENMPIRMSSIISFSRDTTKILPMDSERTPLIIHSQDIPFFKRLSEYWGMLLIDGTIFDGGDMVLSCRGIADNEFMVYYVRESARLGIGVFDRSNIQIGKDGEASHQNVNLQAQSDGEKSTSTRENGPSDVFVEIRAYRNEAGALEKLPGSLSILVAEDILEDLEQDDFYTNIGFVIFDEAYPTPLLMAQLTNSQ